MAIASPKRVYMPEDLIDPEDGRRFELVDDELVERNVSFQSSWIAANFLVDLGQFVRRNRFGKMLESEMGMRLWPEDPTRTRRPDVAFMSSERIPAESTGFLYVAPDLVIEVVSPGDSADKVVAKAHEWLAGGVRVVWVAYPASREIHVYRGDGRRQILGPDDRLTVEDLVPGFSALVASFFE